MIKIISILCLTAVLCSANIEEFEKHLQLFNKSYDELDIYNYRFTIFRENLQKAKELQKQNPYAEFNVTYSKFGDMSSEEFQQLLGYKLEDQKNYSQKTPAPFNFSSVPKSIDWRDQNMVTPVKDQGMCGSCWAFSTVEAIESAYLMSTQGKNPIELSTQQITCCDYGIGDIACNGGSPITAVKYIISAGGLETEKDYPYNNPLMNCYVTKKEADNCYFKKNKAKVTLTGFQIVTRQGNETALAQGLVEHGPLSICLNADTWQNYKSGILTSCGTKLDHCVELVGYNQNADVPYWIVRNSWADSWGINGYIHIKMGENLCGIADAAGYPTGVKQIGGDFYFLPQ